MSAKKRQNYRHLPAFILLAIAQREMHGGAIHSSLCECLPHFNTDTGAVYRSLQELENDGSVQSDWNTSESGPAKRIYHMTPSGWTKLEEWEQDIEARLANLNYFLDTYKKVKEDKMLKEVQLI